MNPTRRVLGFDTETDHDGERAWVVQWAVSDGLKEWTGTDLESFKGRLHWMANRGGTWYLYAVNLRYDWSFVRYAVHEFLQERTGYRLDLIMRRGQTISVTLTPAKGSKYSKIVFRDVLKKMRGSAREIGHMFGVEKLESPTEFYPGWSKDIDCSDPTNLEYVKHDARIAAVAAKYMHREGFDKATSSGDAWKTAKKLVNAGYHGDTSRWRRLFPELPYSLDSRLRNGYAGGINISRGIRCHEGPITHVDMTSMYPTCLYWDEMPFDTPTDIGDEWPGMDRLWVGVLRISLKLREGHVPWFMFRSGYDYVIEDMEFGTIVKETKEYHTLTLTSVDWANLCADYYIEEDPEPPEDYDRRFWVWKSKVGILREYIDRFIKQKNDAAKGSPERAQAKTMLNSVYGRFALAKDAEKTEMVWDEDLQDLTYVSTIEQQEDNDSYLPLAMFCTSYARARLLEMVRAVALERGPDAVIHCDTDSVIYEGEPLDWEEYDKGLGTWAIESRPLKIYEGGFKRYIEVLHEPVRSYHDLSVACAGVPQRVDEEFDLPIGMWVELLDDPELILHEAELGHAEYSIKTPWLRDAYLEVYHKTGKEKYNPDKVNTFKLIPVSVPGGTILEERQHHLSDNMQVRFWRGI